MKTKKFQLIHPANWTVLKVLQFDLTVGLGQIMGTVIYERPYREMVNILKIHATR